MSESKIFYTVSLLLLMIDVVESQEKRILSVRTAAELNVTHHLFTFLLFSMRSPRNVV